MARTERKTTDAEVTLLDLSEVEACALTFLREKAERDGTDMPSSVKVGYRWGCFGCPDGSLYALCDEGVGTAKPITDDDPLVVDVYVDGYEGQKSGSFISIFPAASVNLGPDRVRQYRTGERVNLAEFIRTFGARLDSNYESWRRKFVAEGVVGQ